jgi:hypothetical protein
MRKGLATATAAFAAAFWLAAGLVPCAAKTKLSFAFVTDPTP